MLIVDYSVSKFVLEIENT